MRVRGLAVGYLAAASIALLPAAVVGGPGASLVFGVVAVTFPVVLIVLAASAGAGAPPVQKGALALGATLAAAVAMLVLGFPGRSSATPLLLLLGVGLAPFLLTAVVYATTFDRWGVREEDLLRLRRSRERRRESSRG